MSHSGVTTSPDAQSGSEGLGSNHLRLAHRDDATAEMNSDPQKYAYYKRDVLARIAAYLLDEGHEPAARAVAQALHASFTESNHAGEHVYSIPPGEAGAVGMAAPVGGGE